MDFLEKSLRNTIARERARVEELEQEKEELDKALDHVLYLLYTKADKEAQERHSLALYTQAMKVMLNIEEEN